MTRLDPDPQQRRGKATDVPAGDSNRNVDSNGNVDGTEANPSPVAPKPAAETSYVGNQPESAADSDSALEQLLRSIASRQPSGPSEPLWWVLNFVLPILILLAGVAAVVALGKVEPGRRPDADRSRAGRIQALAPIRTATLRSLADTGQPLHLSADGEVVPYREAEVAAEVSGRVVKKTEICEAGQYVTAGQRLMTIDATDYEMQFEQLSRSQEQSYEALKEVDQETTNVKRLIEVAKEDLQLQEKELSRQKSVPKGYASQKEIDTASRAVLSARQSLVTLQNQLETQSARRTRLEAAEKLAAAQLRAAKINLDRTEIVAPIDGVIVRENADVNSFVNRGAVVVVIESTEKVEVESSLRNDQLYWVLNQPSAETNENRRGYRLPITPAIIQYELTGFENQVYRWKGNLVSYDGIGLDPATRTVPVRIVVDDPRQNVDIEGNPIDAPGAPALVRGMFVSVQLLIEPTANLLVVPADAMQPGNRVYEFVPDESVLEIDPSDQKTEQSDQEPDQSNDSADPDTTIKSPEDRTGENDDDNEDENVVKFDAEKWVAGRVKIRNQIIPVDSLTLGGTSEIDADAQRGLRDSRSYWVCEASASEIQSGSRVVISPLGDLPLTGINARAPLESDGDDQPVDSPKSESVSKTDPEPESAAPTDNSTEGPQS